MVGLRLRHRCDNDAIDGQRGSSRQLLENDMAGKRYSGKKDMAGEKDTA
jgi:hypothetical protein